MRLRNRINLMIYEPESESAIWESMDCGLLIIRVDWIFCNLLNEQAAETPIPL